VTTTTPQMTGWSLVDKLVDRLGNHSYDGGLNGTCYQCVFASPPLDADGQPAAFGVHRPPTEAYFTCALPGRIPVEDPAWGEHAPCTEAEWVNALVAALAAVRPEAVAR
jgi:hypothetical protein